MDEEETKRFLRFVGPAGTKGRVRALARRLERAYGPFEPKEVREPVDELVLTILSQATNDRNSFNAFRRLKARFPTWEAVLDAPVEELEEAIRPGGLSHNKARTLRKVLGELAESSEGITGSLDHLADISPDLAVKTLTDLDGVGRKTAACVLLFSFNLPVMPVDTHVHRLARRLGLVAERANPDRTQEVLMALTPEELVYPFHLWLIAHGRVVCKARGPTCSECVLGDLCPSRH